MQIHFPVGNNTALNLLLSFYRFKLWPGKYVLRLIFSDTTILSQCVLLLSSSMLDDYLRAPFHANIFRVSVTLKPVS